MLSAVSKAAARPPASCPGRHGCPLPFQVWLFRQRPESLDPLSKYLSATTGFGSTYVTTQQVSPRPGLPLAGAGPGSSGSRAWAVRVGRWWRDHAVNTWGPRPRGWSLLHFTDTVPAGRSPAPLSRSLASGPQEVGATPS